MNTIGKVTLLIGLAFGAQVCNTVQEDKKEENAQRKRGNFKAFEVAYNAHEFEAKEAYNLTHPTGSKIQIPAQAFVDEAGKPVTGKVKLNYREFHHASEIITSGITMQYDSAGKKHPFETAGMFDIRAEQAGKPIFLAKDKAIQVDLASHKEGAFNIYYLQEAKQVAKTIAYSPLPFISQAVAQDVIPGEDRWKLMQTSNLPTENKERKTKLAEINKGIPVQPTEPILYDEKAPIFELEVDTKGFPALQALEDILWQYAGDLKNDAQNPDKNEWVFSHQWGSIRLEADTDTEYRLVLQSATKRFESQVRPTFKGLPYDKAKKLFAGRKKEYEQEVEKRKAEIDKLRAEKNYYDRIAKFQRSFEIQNLGIYNCDRIYNGGDPSDVIEVALNLNVPTDPTLAKATKASVYLIADNIAVLYTAQNNKIPAFRLNIKRNNKLLVLFEGTEKVAIYTSEECKRLAQVRKKEVVDIDLTLAKEPIKSTEALATLLAKL